VIDPAAPTGVTLNNPPPASGVGVIPSSVLATAKGRFEAVRRARSSVAESLRERAVGTRTAAFFGAVTAGAEPISAATRKAALDAVDKELVAEKLIAKAGGDVSPEAQKRFGWEREIALPTAGVIVKGCLDDCDVCEPSLDREIALDLDRKALENELLKKQIELLEKSHEYRCCPEGEEEPTP
jgi:hypothetical protein